MCKIRIHVLRERKRKKGKFKIGIEVKPAGSRTKCGVVKPAGGHH